MLRGKAGPESGKSVTVVAVADSDLLYYRYLAEMDKPAVSVAPRHTQDQTVRAHACRMRQCVFGPTNIRTGDRSHTEPHTHIAIYLHTTTWVSSDAASRPVKCKMGVWGGDTGGETVSCTGTVPRGGPLTVPMTAAQGRSTGCMRRWCELSKYRLKIC